MLARGEKFPYSPSQFLPLYTCPLDFSASQVRLVYTSQRTTHTRSMVYYSSRSMVYYSSRDLGSDPVGVYIPLPHFLQVVGFLLGNRPCPLILPSCGFPPWQLPLFSYLQSGAGGAPECLPLLPSWITSLTAAAFLHEITAYHS